MTGGLGNDTYYVDNVNDVVVETSTLTNEIDTVMASVSYTLGANLENLTYTGVGNFVGAGNTLDNIMVGGAGNDLLKTTADNTGTEVLGTLNNCGAGQTPWGTYITAEENWAACFVNTGNRPPHQQRVGVSAGPVGRYQWETAAKDPSEVLGEFARFNVTETGASELWYALDGGATSALR